MTAIGTMKKALHWTCVYSLLTALALAVPPALAGGISIEPKRILPDANGIARFSVHVDGIPAPGFRAYALKVTFIGPNFRLVDSINTAISPVSESEITCAGKLRSDRPNVVVVPGTFMLIESGQGGLVMDSSGIGTIVSSINKLEENTGIYNFGILGQLTNALTGNGGLIDFSCYVGINVPTGVYARVMPSLYPGLKGAIFLNQRHHQGTMGNFTGGSIAGRSASQSPWVPKRQYKFRLK